VVRVKPSHFQFDSSHTGSATTSDHSTSESHEHIETVVYAKVNRHHATKKTTSETDHNHSTITNVAIVNSPDDEIDSHMIPKEPETSMTAHDAKTYNQKPSPQENVQLVSMKPVSDVKVVPASAQSFPAHSSYDMQPIHYMASVGDKKKLAQILSQLDNSDDDQAGTRGNVDMRDSEGRTPLMHAIHNEHFACAKMLMDAGADVDIISNGLLMSNYHKVIITTMQMVVHLCIMSVILALMRC